MNPAFGIIAWIVVGALAGWIGSMIMGTNAKMGAVANIVVGIVGALVGGFVTRLMFGDNPGNNGFLVSLGVALLGSCIVLAIVKAVSGGGGRRAI